LHKQLVPNQAETAQTLREQSGLAKAMPTCFRGKASVLQKEGVITMSIATKLTELATKPLPKMISPKLHAAIDWGIAAAFLTAGALLWRKNKRAALAFYISGDLIGSVIFFTDCPGGVSKKISFETHGKIDPGIAALVASLPNLMSFSDEPEARLFQSIGIALATVRNLTAFEEGSTNAETRSKVA
jgi:hypothetical protein